MDVSVPELVKQEMKVAVIGKVKAALLPTTGIAMMELALVLLQNPAQRVQWAATFLAAMVAVMTVVRVDVGKITFVVTHALLALPASTTHLLLVMDPVVGGLVVFMRLALTVLPG